MSKSDAVTHPSLDSPLSLTNTTVTLDDGSASQDPQDGGSVPAPRDSSFLFNTSIPKSNTTVSSDNTIAASLAENVDSPSRGLQDPVLTGPTPTVPPTSTTKNSDMDVDEPASGTVQTSTTKNSDMDVVEPASATVQTLDPPPIDVDEEKEEVSTNVVEVAAPPWLTAHHMDVYLQECSIAKEWQLLVQSLYKFEEGNAIKGVRH